MPDRTEVDKNVFPMGCIKNPSLFLLRKRARQVEASFFKKRESRFKTGIQVISLTFYHLITKDPMTDDNTPKGN